MLKFKNWMLGVLVISVLLTSCGKTIDESQVLVDYLESVDSPIDVAGIAKYITATDVQALLPNDAYIIDIRSAEDFSTLGHIAGAVQVNAGDVISHLEGVDTGSKKIVITCYTGQTAAFTSSLARLAGFDTYSLKWGMCSWNAATAGPLNSNSKNTYEDQLVTTITEKAAEGALPMLETGFETAEEILDARIDEVLTAGFSEAAITADKVFDTPDNYYIMNYWSDAHYNLGHVPGAIQYTPNVDILSTEALTTLPTNKTIVVYCYTGQTSAYLTAYLKVLGYDAKSLKFGMNGMATDWAAANELTHWDNTSYVAGYDLSFD